MKYVAFIDTLGFKQRITSISHEEAVEVIRRFNEEIYNLWREEGLDNNDLIRGRTFSDSIIVHSTGHTIAELERILQFLVKLYRISITVCDLPLRGGLALGNFDDLQAVEFSNLQKGILVGNGFIDAYILESGNEIKGSKLLFSDQINSRISECRTEYVTQKVKDAADGNSIYELRWGDVEFLRSENYGPLNKFVDLATKSKWLEHYYGTIETFLIREEQEVKVDIFGRIIDRINENFRYNDLDNFIENYLKGTSAPYTKKSFLAFIRRFISS
ncbi:MAG: hypothetical protein ACO1NS_11210 [Daejeonella sp.]